MSEAPPAYPYIPNSAPRIKREMLDAIGVTDVEELFRYSMRSLLSVPGLREDEVMPARPVRTVFETKALQRGSQLYGASLRRVDASAQRRSA